MATGGPQPTPPRPRRARGFGDYAVGAALLLGVCAIVLWPVLRDSSPVIKRDMLEATVEAIVWMPSKPGLQNPVSDGYRYRVRVQTTNETVMVSDFTARPHTVGSQVTLERRTRLSGVSSYHFVP